MNAILIFGLLFTTSLSGVLSECPDETVISPCTGCQFNYINCSGSEDIDLKTIFETLSKTSSTEQKQYDFFYLNNTHLTTLGDGVFQDIVFDEIIIDSTNLESINTGINMNTFGVTKQLKITNNSQLTGDSIVDYMKMFANIETIYETNNSKFTQIPDNAFTTNVPKTHLSSLQLWSPLTIGSYALRNLTMLKSLVLGYGLNHISENAFNFDEPSNTSLYLGLGLSKLQGQSFAPCAFCGIKRPSILHLSTQSTGLTFLKKDTFLAFLLSDIRNKINLFSNPLDCNDCRSFWIKQNDLGARIDWLQCTNNSTFNDPGNFAHCK